MQITIQANLLKLKDALRHGQAYGPTPSSVSQFTMGAFHKSGAVLPPEIAIAKMCSFWLLSEADSQS
jgi:hypothetical protein